MFSQYLDLWQGADGVHTDHGWFTIKRRDDTHSSLPRRI